MFSLRDNELTSSGQFLIGTTVVLLATYLYSSLDRHIPPPIHIHSYEKTTIGRETSEVAEPSLKVPTTPMKSEGLSTSRPSSPMGHHTRVGSARGYFAAKHRDE